MKKFDAFISYETSSGKEIAMKLCDHLENGGLTCWIAPRNIQYGQVYAGIISGAIKNSEFVLCIYTENTNHSENVKRELELANANRISILPFVTCDVPFDPDLEYYFAAHQQIRVHENNLKKGFEDALTTIASVVGKEKTIIPNTVTSASMLPVSTIKAEPEKEKEKHKIKWKSVAISAGVLIVAVVIALILLNLPERQSEQVVVKDVEEVQNLVKELKLTFNVGGQQFSVIMINDSVYLGETEVTQGLWQTVMGTSIKEQRDKANKLWSTRGCCDDSPMYYVNINECMAFAAKLSSMTGERFELPTEEEWEMGVNEDNESNLESVAWYAEISNDSVHPVGGKNANGFGIYDMAGNVSEWCNTSVNGKYVLRGGDWSMSKRDCGIKVRELCNADLRRSSLGFRIILKR